MQELSTLGLLATAEQPEPRPVTAEDVAKMPFLDAIVHESLRLMSPAPNGGFRVLETEMTVRTRSRPILFQAAMQWSSCRVRCCGHGSQVTTPGVQMRQPEPTPPPFHSPVRPAQAFCYRVGRCPLLMVCSALCAVCVLHSTTAAVALGDAAWRCAQLDLS